MRYTGEFEISPSQVRSIVYELIFQLEYLIWSYVHRLHFATDDGVPATSHSKTELIHEVFKLGVS